MVQQISAPCKINLHLKIKPGRPDGFHDLESVFVLVDFADTLVFQPPHPPSRAGDQAGGRISGGKEPGEIRVSMRPAGPFLELISRNSLVFEEIPPEKNLVYRAAALFRQRTGFSPALDITVVKRIPPGSGLGGGSSNAAAVLLALNARAAAAGLSLSRVELLRMAAELGSDVSFFIHAGHAAGETAGYAAWVAGRGERIKPLPPPPPLGLLLVFPAFPSHTGAAFALLDRIRGESASPPPVSPLTYGRVRRVLKKWPAPADAGPPADARRLPAVWPFGNDFLDLFLNHGPENQRAVYAGILGDLKAAGAFFTGLSGSGSACFGIFKSLKEAEGAKKTLKKASYAVQSTFFLARPPRW
ncbi:MAG: 4-(cytidine 5'-diphospho)-2-C-methyl-D-erythritol kinase [Treponema sp.]|jgi:4-diphosphocytidyl-2-C-methyl-D-erythritol kinase|nr:4-(cytidine 5'-diphospho)-2-C-methyl-D-erythritol kinase [Treponema sp.]